MSAGFQRKLDLAPTASIDKVALNNRVVLMRAVVRRSKLHLINALVKRVHKLRDKKGSEAQKSQNKSKAERMLEDIKIIKVLKPDYVSKYALGTTEKFEEIAAKPNTSADVRALARLAAHKFIMQEVAKFRHEHEDWKELTAYLMTKHTSREFKKKKTKEKLKKVETNVKASETLVQKYLGEKLDGRDDLDNTFDDDDDDNDDDNNDDDNDDDGDDRNDESKDDSDESEEEVNDKIENKHNTEKDVGKQNSDRTEYKTVESVRKMDSNLKPSGLKIKVLQKHSESKRMDNSVQSDKSGNTDSGSDSNEDNESEDDGDDDDDHDHDHGSDDDDDDDDDDVDDNVDDESVSDNEDDSENEFEHSEKTSGKHKAKLLETKTNKTNSKEKLLKKSKHKESKHDDFTKISKKKNTSNEKVEGEMIVKKLNLAKDFVEDDIPKILLTDNEDKPAKRKKKTRDLFFDMDDDDDSVSLNKDETALNDDGDTENVDNETLDNNTGGNSEGSIQPTMTAFTTCFVGSLKSSDMMACKDSQYRSNEDWKRIRHETKEQKMGRGRGSQHSFSRGRGQGPMSRGGGFVSHRGQDRGFSDSFRGRGFSQGPRGRGFSEDRGRGFSQGPRGRGFSEDRGRGRSSENFRGRGRGQGFSGTDRGNPQTDSKKQSGLHPSWEASKKRKQEEKGVFQAFEGKKIKFD